MQRHFLFHDLFQILYLEEIIQNYPIIIGGLALFVLCIHQLIGQLIIFHDGRSAVFQTHNAHLLIRCILADHLGAYHTVSLNRSADKARICDPLQYIVYGKYIQPFNAFFMNDIQHTVIFHGNKPAAVTIGGSGQPALFLQIDLTFVIGSRRHLLFEEMHILCLVSEVVMLL